jgi:hypothetical protein
MQLLLYRQACSPVFIQTELSLYLPSFGPVTIQAELLLLLSELSVPTVSVIHFSSLIVYVTSLLCNLAGAIKAALIIKTSDQFINQERFWAIVKKI